MALPLLILSLLALAPLLAQTPPGLEALTSDAPLPSPERNWTRLGVQSWELRKLNRTIREDGVEGWNVAYKSGDLRIAGYMAHPFIKYDEEGKPKEQWPLIVINPGGNQGVSVPYRQVALEFVRRGYIVIASGYRGGRGPEGRSEGSPEYAKGEVIDVLQMAQLLRKMDYVDSLRMGVIGEGHGAAITAQIVTRSNIFTGAVIANPVLFSGTPEHSFAGLQRLRSIYQTSFGRSLSESQTIMELRLRDSFRNAAKITTPSMVIASDNDPGIGETLRWIALLREKGVPYEFVHYRSMFPNFLTAVDNGTRPPDWEQTRSEAWSVIFEWMETHVPSGPLVEDEEEIASAP